MFTVYEKIKAFYSEQLFIWGLWTQRLCVLKASSIQESERDREEHNSLKMTVDCSNDSEAVIDVTTDEHEVILQGKSRLQGVNALLRVPAKCGFSLARVRGRLYTPSYSGEQSKPPFWSFMKQTRGTLSCHKGPKIT